MAQQYEIRLKGHLDLTWSEWFGDDWTIIHQENGETLLIGPIADQSALHGLLNRLRDIGITLIAVNPAEPGESIHDNSSSTPD